jgi:uncharacterized protein (TIGR00730 family)
VKRLCVFCGANSGARPSYAKAAVALGELLAKEGIGLVYGGGNVGLMGIVADAVMSHGGDVIGVIPKSLYEKEVAHLSLPDLRVVNSMHERKAMMAELSDGFIALPGGFGTFEEIFEIITWTQLGLYKKPCGFLNIDGFYDLLSQFVGHATTQGFIRGEAPSIAVFANEPTALLEKFRNWQPPVLESWITKKET